MKKDTVPISEQTKMKALIIEPSDKTTETPVLLFLHGRGEASENDISQIDNHESPSVQVRKGYLQNVILVAPQCPENPKPNKDWNWKVYLKDISSYLEKNFSQSKVFAVGFSRGGLGVLQLLQQSPNLISKWAIIDPQCLDHHQLCLKEENATEKRIREEELFKSINSCGWLRYGKQYSGIKAFSERLSDCRKDVLGKNSHYYDLEHTPLAKAAFNGCKLGGSENLYDFLGLTYKKPDVSEKFT